MATPTVLSFRQILGVPPSVPTIRDSVLVIIDAQNEYKVGKLRCEEVEVSAKVIQRLLGRYRSGGGDVVHIVHGG